MPNPKVTLKISKGFTFAAGSAPRPGPPPVAGADFGTVWEKNLPPGGYTAQVSGAGGTTGNGLVEVYEIPAQGGG